MSKLKEQIDNDIKIAMIARNNVAKEILKFIKSEIQRKEGGLMVMSDSDVEKLIRNQVENLKITPSETSEEEIRVLETYLPQLLSDKKVEGLVRGFINDHINSGGSVATLNVGAIMKYFNANFKGQVDNKLVSDIAKQMLEA